MNVELADQNPIHPTQLNEMETTATTHYIIYIEDKLKHSFTIQMKIT